MNNEQSDFRDLQFVDLRLQNGQVELKLEYTYQQILATQAEQVNNKANLHNTNTKMAENMLESTNILDFDKLAKKA